MRRFFALKLTLIAPLFWAAGCATSFEVVQLPERSADLYPLALTQGETTAAVDDMRDPDRVRRYFGINLLELDIVPVNIVVSNHTEEPLLVKPADVLLHRDNAIIDPLPVENVAALAKRPGRLNRETREQVDAYYRDLAFKATVVAPNDTYQGVLFFPIEDPDGNSKNLFRRMALWRQGDMQLDAVVETARQDDRLHFGPFGLAGPNPRRWF